MFLAMSTFKDFNVIANVFEFEGTNSSLPYLVSITAIVKHRNAIHMKGCTMHVEIKKMCSLITKCRTLSHLALCCQYVLILQQVSNHPIIEIVIPEDKRKCGCSS